MTNITFTYQLKHYTCSMDAYDRNLMIMLPDGRVLEVFGGWFERNPPIPAGFVDVTDSPKIIQCEFAHALEVGHV